MCARAQVSADVRGVPWAALTEEGGINARRDVKLSFRVTLLAWPVRRGLQGRHRLGDQTATAVTRVSPISHTMGTWQCASGGGQIAHVGQLLINPPGSACRRGVISR